MKKVCLFIIAIISFIYIPVVSAENYSKFIARTRFANDIAVSSIPSIIVLMSAPGYNDFIEIELTKENLFNYESDKLPVGAEFDSAYVEGDRFANYYVVGDFKVDGDTASLDVYVSIYSLDNFTSTTTTTTKQTQIADSNDIIIIDDNGQVKTTVTDTNGINPETTNVSTTLSAGASKRMELYKYVLFAVLILVGFVLLVIVVKVIRTSKLM